MCVCVCVCVCAVCVCVCVCVCVIVPQGKWVLAVSFGEDPEAVICDSVSSTVIRRYYHVQCVDLVRALSVYS